MTEAVSKVQPAAEKENIKNEDEPAKILIVDDDLSIRAVLSEILTQEGYKTTGAATAKEAIAACQRESFDMGLIDIRLPDMEGTELLQVLKKLSPSMIKMVVTGFPSLENAILSVNLGAEGYITKPFKPVKLLEQIKEQLEKHRIDRWEKLLRNMGLSLYEARLYLSLALNGSSEARKLSMTAGVPRTKAYATLKKLTQRGMIIEIPGVPQRFSIATPSNAFAPFVQSWKKELSEQGKNLTEFENAISTLEAIYAEKQTAQPMKTQKEEAWSTQSSEEIAKQISYMLSLAKKSVHIITTEKGLIVFYKNFCQALDDPARKDIEIWIKVPTESLNASFVSELRYTYKIENAPITLPVFMIIVDKKDLLLTSLRVSDFGAVTELESGLFAHSEFLGSFLSDLLGFNKK
jgi:DNA-binding response OmpR family regulator